MSPTRMMFLSAFLASACGLSSHGNSEASTSPLTCAQQSDCPGTSTCDAKACKCTLDSDCGSNFECEHGACARHREAEHGDAAAAMSCNVDSDCSGGLECEHGSCQPHGGNRNDAGDDRADDDNSGPGRGNDDRAGHGGAGGDDHAHAGAGGAGSGASCVYDRDCTNGLECEHGSCQPHRGGRDDDAGVDDHGDDNRGRGNGDNEDENEDRSGHGNGGADDDKPVVSGQTCVKDADCAADQRCKDGYCDQHGGPGRH